MECINPCSLILQSDAAGSDHHYACSFNPPTHPGAMGVPMPQYHMLPDYRRIERVPRPLYLSPQFETFSGITFSVNGWAGVRVKDILKDTVIIDAAYDTVLQDHGWRSIVVNLEWPGYELNDVVNHMHSRIDVCPCGRDITRLGLAREVCSLLFSFHKIVTKHPISPDQKKWALTAGPEGIRVTDIVLLSMHYYRNIWVPELYVIE